MICAIKAAIASSSSFIENREAFLPVTVFAIQAFFIFASGFGNYLIWTRPTPDREADLFHLLVPQYSGSERCSNCPKTDRYI
jgi:hypothetical protein